MVEAWLDQPADGKLCGDSARLPMKAGAVANGIDVTLFEDIKLGSPTYETELRDICV